MMGKLWTKVGVVLVGGFLLGSGLILAAQPVQAHPKGESLPSPSCSSSIIPGDAFFDTTDTPETFDISASTTSSTTLRTKRGTGVSGGGDIRYHYAKITIPALAAGELRVFDSGTLSDAFLCRGNSEETRSITSYSAHDNAHTDAATAIEAAKTARRAAGYHLDPDGDDQTNDAIDLDNLSATRDALDRARRALSAARTALSNARTDLNVFSTTDAATAANNALIAETDALTAYNDSTPPSTNTENVEELRLANESLITAINGLAAAATALAGTNDDGTAGAAAALTAAAEDVHSGFMLRAEVSPGDEEYVVVVAPQNTDTPPRAAEAMRTLNAAFHGAIDTTDAANLNGSLSIGGRPSYTIRITAPGLLTLETTGSTDTVGMLDDNAGADVTMAESGGNGGNFKIVVPVQENGNNENYTLYVEGQTSQTAGDYTLDIDFKVAMTHYPDANVPNVEVDDGPDWGAVGIRDDGDATAMIRPELDGTSDEDYFLFTITGQGFLAVQASDDSMTAAASDADTTGTLYGSMGEIDTDLNSGAENHFKINAPVDAGNYIVKVTGRSAGGYLLNFALATATEVAVRGTQGTTTGMPNCPSIAPYEICAATGATQETDQYTIPIEESGALYIHTVGSLDTVGVLYGPDGSKIAENDNTSAENNNFRIATNVDPGLHLLQVRAKTRTMSGVYELVTSFVAGDVVTDPTTPGTGTEVEELRAQVTQLQRDLETCEAGVETDARGTLENPSGGGYRSGIGLISGWVCEANEVTVEILSGGVVRETLDVAYGTSRPDVPENPDADCDNPNTGFGMTYNFNHLSPGEYTIRAEADGERFGLEETFNVVHLTEFARTDDDRFLRDLPAGTCDVEDFPYDGDATRLRWEQSTQNFVIEDAG